VIPFWLMKLSESSPDASPELIVTVAPTKLAVSGELTVRVEVTCTGGVPAKYCNVAVSIFASTGAGASTSTANVPLGQLLGSVVKVRTPLPLAAQKKTGPLGDGNVTNVLGATHLPGGTRNTDSLTAWMHTFTGPGTTVTLISLLVHIDRLLT
jgi:hypothetical protein